MFSLAPVLLVVVTIAGALFGPDAVRGRIVHQFGGLMGDEQAEMVQTILQRTQQEKASGLATVVGIVTLLFGATAVDPSVGLRIDASGNSVRAELPITVQGAISRGKLQGTLGSGSETLRLHTSGGGVRIQGL